MHSASQGATFDRIPVPRAALFGLPPIGNGVYEVRSGKLLFAVDLSGTLLFAIEGATAAIGGNLDLLALMVFLRLGYPEASFATC